MAKATKSPILNFFYRIPLKLNRVDKNYNNIERGSGTFLENHIYIFSVISESWYLKNIQLA